MKKRAVLVGLILVLFIVSRQFKVIRVVGNSMCPTFGDGSFHLATNSLRLERGSVLVIDRQEGTVVKRLIGLPGETIEFRHGLLFVDGEHVIENYSIGTVNDMYCELTDDEIFVLGDNRESSVDSRDYGPVSVKRIKSVVLI